LETLLYQGTMNYDMKTKARISISPREAAGLKAGEVKSIYQLTPTLKGGVREEAASRKSYSLQEKDLGWGGRN
jgi:uncharacterized lipoprotein YajG